MSATAAEFGPTLSISNLAVAELIWVSLDGPEHEVM